MSDSPAVITHSEIEQAADIIRDGGIVAFPTETYYGLGVDPFNGAAIAKLYSLKRRPESKAVLVLVPDRTQVDLLAAEVPPAAYRLMDAFWPGPLTLVLPARSEVPIQLTGFTGTVGVRLSPHPVVRSLLAHYGGPVTATSANRSGILPATTAGEVASAFGPSVDLILDGGRTEGLQPSTLIGFAGEEVELIREGRVPFEQIRNVLAESGQPS